MLSWTRKRHPTKRMPVLPVNRRQREIRFSPAGPNMSPPVPADRAWSRGSSNSLLEMKSARNAHTAGARKSEDPKPQQ